MAVGLIALCELCSRLFGMTILDRDELDDDEPIFVLCGNCKAAHFLTPREMKRGSRAL